MDLAANPSKYRGSRAAIDKANQAWAQFGNLTSGAHEGHRIQLRLAGRAGPDPQGSQNLPGPPGWRQTGPNQTGYSAQHASELSRRVRVEVTAASVAE